MMGSLRMSIAEILRWLAYEEASSEVVKLAEIWTNGTCRPRHGRSYRPAVGCGIWKEPKLTQAELPKPHTGVRPHLIAGGRGTGCI